MLESPLSLAQTLDCVPEACLVVDSRMDRIVACNGMASQMLSLDDPQAVRFSKLIGQNLARFILFVEEIDYRGEAWTRDIRLRTAKGDRACEMRGRKFGGSVDQVLLMFVDLAELERRAQIVDAEELHRSGLDGWKRAQSFFAELENQNQLILNAAGEGIYGVNAEGKTTFANRAAQEMLGWSFEELAGKSIHDMIHHHHVNGDVYHAHDCPIYRSFRFEQVHRIEDEVFWRKDGKPIRVEYVSTPIYDQQVLAGAVVIFRDITERKENEQKLRDALHEVADLRDRLEQENAYLQEAITSEQAHHDILGEAPSTQHLRRRIDLVASTDANVLITGEAGTGKALVANAIHNSGARRRRALIHLRCGSVATEAMAAELFGQIRGAYPGALRDKPGKLELAHGGTVFLDNVEELPLEHQGQLLRALQDREVTRMGDTRPRAIDVRVIAATTTSLEQAVASNRFREDLFLFLNVFPITCHPLRDRIEDIPVLATHLLSLANKRLNRPNTVITKRTMDQLQNYGWPGNVRELRNVIERAAIVSRGGKLIVDVGDARAQQQGGQAHIKTEAELQAEARANLVACLKETEGRVSGPDGAAKILGIPATTLYSRIKKYRIADSEWQGRSAN
ncbi:sigma 54-interacting transcriptional regulator [Roseibacterium sp. SDUM158017]|uniref:sigma 54-interacting transcriptional regulator n=1 Tax=Roseicyclus salinarum TaxID=3036773 RepID=UPI0024155517|nr:sigma 54-interacting transcriptional regulator [Roseibacterium sp. SDUM158017]MDG4648705.1 sigma 54-interacting transcriptional regulator [Roseibacterium sp. SDUM158017]